MENRKTIGLIAGRGQFPVMVARAARESGIRVACLGFNGFTDPSMGEEAEIFLQNPLGQLNRHIAFFREHGVQELTFAGSISKPKALDIKPDWRAARLLFSLRAKGDDALLRAVINELESEGFAVRKADELVPELRGPAGVLSRRKPTEEEWDDLRLGWTMAKDLGRLDIGQCLFMKRGIVAAVEALEGTDAAIRRGGSLAGEAGVVIKVAKPRQEERIDLPSVGLQTILTLREVKACCLGYEAGKTLFFDRRESLAAADAAGIAVVGLTAEDIG